MVKTYTTRSMEKKLLGDVLKASKTATTKRKRLKKGTVVDEENIEVDDVGDGEKDIDINIDAVTEKKRKKVQERRGTRSSQAIPKICKETH